jgi:IS5 family transposase
MRPKQQPKARHDDLFRARLDQIINMKQELDVLADKIDWAWLDDALAACFSNQGRPAESVRFMIGMFLLKHTYALSDEQVWDRWVQDPYFQYFTGEEFFQHQLLHERSGMSHWRKRIGGKLDILLAETLRIAHDTGALKKSDLARVTIDTTVQRRTSPSRPTPSCWRRRSASWASWPRRTVCRSGNPTPASQKRRR